MERANRRNKSAVSSVLFFAFFCELTHIRQNQRVRRQVGFRRPILGLSLEGLDRDRRLAPLIYLTSNGCAVFSFIGHYDSK